MEKIIINGGTPLFGQVEISGFKNAALPIIYATVLVKGKCVLENIPAISDITYSFEILKGIGAKVRMIDSTTYEVDCTDVQPCSSDYDLVRRIRGSYYLLGAEFGRFGCAKVALPGGCNFGVRPIDQHIKGFEALGGIVNTEGGYVEISSENGTVGKMPYFRFAAVVRIVLMNKHVYDGFAECDIVWRHVRALQGGRIDPERRGCNSLIPVQQGLPSTNEIEIKDEPIVPTRPGSVFSKSSSKPLAVGNRPRHDVTKRTITPKQQNGRLRRLPALRGFSDQAQFKKELDIVLIRVRAIPRLPFVNIAIPGD